MNEQGLFIGVVAVALYNGLFSPFTFIVMSLAQAWMPSFVPFSMPTAIYGASLIVATTTLLLAGVPAALYERWRKTGQHGDVLPDLAHWCDALDPSRPRRRWRRPS